MSKSFKILLFTALLLVFAQSLNLFEDEKISFNPSQIQYESNELKDLEKIDIRVRMDYDYHQDMVVGYNGTFYFFSEFNDSVSNIFDPETIEKETSFKTFMVDTNQHVLNTTCRFWKPEDIIIIREADNNHIIVLCIMSMDTAKLLIRPVIRLFRNQTV